MSTATVTEQEHVYTPLTALDRCDRCGAQAYVRWAKGAQDLLTCGHYTTAYEADLLGAGFSIHEDNRDLLTQRPVAAY